MKYVLLSVCGMVLLAISGCRDESPPTATAPAQPSPGLPAGQAGTPATQTALASATAAAGRPQAKLPTVKVWIGTNELAAEIARTVPQISTGMMWRTNMAEMEGMLFVFPQPQQVSFYMRNTLVPLSCAYIDPEGTIIELYDMKPLDETPIPSVSHRIQYVLEVNQGWFERHNVTPGMRAGTEHGTLTETFFRRRP